MAEEKSSIVVGVFIDRNRAERAIDKLHRAGYREAICWLKQKEGIARIASRMAADARRNEDMIVIANDDISEALLALGMPREEVYYYCEEIAARRIVIVLDTELRSMEAKDILRRCGAYDITVPRCDRPFIVNPVDARIGVRDDAYSPNIPMMGDR
ncbi:hypothetical protein EPA93_23130 [Ktedonosporobacter rubrisoli]|uniref:Uncharacterized protein n=1 Tax=Ktedonosporobacter rubrisoli TaxID=2509675 RepID=A0A4P6JT29_KTERU|nr:hypothetical protein [Ktedonosporobacter rubrisoli]QBD78717.1 hypothetical protein EPA93_23130 [Ktedonosporobacter rubrisoli]